MPQTTVVATESAGEGGFWASAYPIIPHPAELIVGLVALAILYVVVKRQVVPRFEQAFHARAEAIEGGMARAEQAQREAQAALAQYRTQLAGARDEAAQIRADAQSERAAIIEEARREAQVAAQAVADRSAAQVQAELAQARTALSRDVGRIAVDLASRVVGANLADTDSTRATVDRFIGDLETSGVPALVGAGGTNGSRGASSSDGQGGAGLPDAPAGGATALDVADGSGVDGGRSG